MLDMPSSRHSVQFYEDEDVMVRTVSAFVAEGLSSQEPVVVIATPERRAGVTRALHAHGIDVSGRQAVGELHLHDARETLATFMDGGRPNRDRFRQTVGNVIASSRRGVRNRRVRAYGEMVNVLWRDGQKDAALKLEELWNELLASESCVLLCGYALDGFSDASQRLALEAVCDQHDHVVPAQSYSLADDHERMREIASLQQQAHALETEIARRREVEKTLLHREAELQVANRLKDEFLAIVSHELRTPLNAIIGWASIAQAHWADQDTVQRALTVIARNGDQQARIINDLLDVSRIMTGKLHIARERVDLVSVIAGAVENVRPAVAAKQIDLQMEIDAVNCVVTGDPGRLTQIVWNLLSNAVKFTPAHGRVTVRLDRMDADARLVVRDTGPGIAPDLLPHIFDRFRQGDATRTRSHGGLGLGLAVVRDLVAAHGGTVEADAGGGQPGSTFTVRLPRHVTPSPETSPHSDDAEHELPHLDARIVVVDDDQDARELLEYLLSASGAHVETAGSADEALERIGEGCDLVIADIGMPIRDGYSLLADIRSHADPDIRDLPVVAATAYTAEAERRKALSAGFDDFVTKPIDPDRLTHVVSTLLARKAGRA